MREPASAYCCFVALTPVPLRSTLPLSIQPRCFRPYRKSRQRLVPANNNANVVKAVSSSSSSASTVEQVEPRLLVDEILEAIKPSENGQAASAEHKKQVDEKLNRLITYGDRTEICYIEDASIFDTYEVSYTSSAMGYRPDGGGFRTQFFQNMGAFQHLIQPDIAVNSVLFRLLGVIPGTVGLYGKLSPDKTLGINGVTIKFEPPRLEIFGAVWRLGKESQVRLRIAYLDDRVRIGVGGSGSLFVFTRCPPAKEGAMEWKKLLFDKDDGRVIPYVGLQLFLTLIISSIMLLCAVVVRHFIS